MDDDNPDVKKIDGFILQLRNKLKSLTSTYLFRKFYYDIGKGLHGYIHRKFRKNYSWVNHLSSFVCIF